MDARQADGKKNNQVLQSQEPTALGFVYYYLLLLPIQTVLEVVTKLLGPLANPLVPILVCLFLVPVAGLFSLSAGWTIWRSAAVGWEAPLDLQYGDGGPPYAELTLPTLVAQQPYDISLHLAIPATDSNFALGNFMTTLTLSSVSNKTLVSVRRSAIAAPQPARYFPGASSVVKLRISLLSVYTPGTENLVAKVEIGRRDGWRTLGNGEGRELAVLDASLRGRVHHQGVRGLITRFPLVSAALSAFIFFTVSVLMLAACVLPTIQQRPVRAALPPAEEFKMMPSGTQPSFQPERGGLLFGSDSGLSEDELSPKMRRDSRASSGGRTRRRSREIKPEEAFSSVSSPEMEARPLRRRRSQRQSDSDN